MDASQGEKGGMPGDDSDLLQAEYQHFAQAFLDNEQLGERRLQIFLGLVTAVLGGLAALAKNDAGWQWGPMLPVAFGALVGLLALGVLTFARTLRRNGVSDRYKKVLKLLRASYPRGLQVQDVLAKGNDDRTIAHGGLAYFVAAINALLVGPIAYVLMAWLAVPERLQGPLAWLCCVVAFGIHWRYAGSS